MIIKDKIQIMGVTWNIRFEKNPKCPITDEQKEDGLIEYPDAYHIFDIPEIVIDSSFAEQIQAIAFYHELIHIIRAAIGLNGDYEINPQNEGFIECESQIWNQIIEQIIKWQEETK